MNKNFTTGNPSRNTPHYEYPEGIPECHADIVEELQTKVQDIRLIHIQKGDSNKKNRSGNAAVVKLEIPTGKVYNLEATSKRDPLNIPGEEDGPKQFFVPRFDRARGCLNECDAEYKLFNALAQDLERDDVSLDVEGILYLYTEKDMCSGCNITCDEDFKMRFPNIQVIIFYNQPYP
ncbi:deaminase domain-containing protein [Microcoleus sp. w2-18bC1]|uniref:deaminase domain-containing protein n=1 Tax=unclassified Microcoleus TaxID=2642155 RepID=UPI002FD590DB